MLAGSETSSGITAVKTAPVRLPATSITPAAIESECLFEDIVKKLENN